MTAKTGVAEWAETHFNLEACDSKCPNGCFYCYAPERKRRYGRTPKQKNPRKLYPGTVMFPTRHDLTEENVKEAIRVLQDLFVAGNSVLVVTKPRLSVVEKICKILPAQGFHASLSWRFTIGSTSDETLRFWEPLAPSFTERIQALAYAWVHGYSTSVSMEPILDIGPRDPGRVIEAALPFVTDTIWLGIMRRAESRLRMNGASLLHIERAGDLRRSWTRERLLTLYNLWSWCPKIRWKDSIQDVLGINSSGKPEAAR